MLIGLLTVLVLIKNSLVKLRERRGHINANYTSSNLPDINDQITQNSSKDTKSKQKPKKHNKLLTKFDIEQAQQQQQENATMSATATVTIPTISGGKDNIDGTQSAANTSIIVFKPGEKQSCFEIGNKNVKIIGSPGTHDHGSSKVKLKNIVDYKWEVKNYPGHLIAVHIDGKHIAYVINVNNKASRTEGMIRVVNAQSSLRALIKGMSGEVLDLQFAHIEKEHILASIDQNSLYVHKIDMLDGTLLCNLIIKVEDPLTNYTPKFDKISWCPFIEIPGEDDEDSKLIVWARGSIFQCFNVNVIVNEHGIGKIHPEALTSGYLKFHDEQMTISWVALSPDGSTLSVASTEGVIRFYQVYMHDKEPRCLHQWKPHNGKQVSSFFFLDNVTSDVSDTYWKYAITAAVNNTEFKVWDCGSWDCLQTVTFATGNEDKKSLHFIAEIDRTSSYLVLTSLETRTCYVLQVVQDIKAIREDILSDSAKDTSSSSTSSSLVSTNSNLKRTVYIKSVSEFPLNSGILSFSIVDAAVRRYKCANDNYLCEELDDYDEETNSIYCVVVRMFIVQSKSMQECRILYQPTVTENTDVKSTMSSENSLVSASKEASLLESANNSHNNSSSNNSATTKNKANGGGAGAEDDAVDDDADIDDEEEDDDDVDVDDEEENTYISAGIKYKKDKASAEKNPLEALLSAGGATNQITLQTTTTTTTSSSVVAVAAAAANAPSAVLAEKTESRTASPQVAAAAAAAKSFGQVNLMTPDAFSSTLNDRKTPENVSSEVLNAILMLASVTGQTAPAVKPENINLLNFVNNKMLEDQEHQKMQLKQAMEIEKKFIAIDNNPARDNMTSGGSSPSREVQEIMSLQDYDKSSFSGDELLLDEPTKSIMADDSVSVPVDVSVTEIDASSVKTTNKTSTTTWPNVPDMHKVTTATKHSTELQNAANLMSQAVNASSAANLNNSHVPPTLNSSNNSSCASGVGVASTVAHTNAVGNNDLAEINMKMNQLLDLVKVQSMQINNLQTEISEMKKTNPMASAKSMSEFSFKLEMQLSKLMEQYLKRYENEHKKKLTAFMAGRDVQNRELRDSIMQLINQYVLTQFTDVVSKVITIEIQRQLAPMLAAKIDNLQQQIQLDVAQKLTAFDIMLKENIAQVCKSKNIIDTFGKSVLVGVQGSLQAAFIESMSSTLIPAYEKSSQNMFKQLHDAFSVGIKEFMEQFDNYLQLLQPMRESSEEILNKFLGFRQHLETMLVKHRSSVTETMLETRKDVKSLEILLSRQIQELLRSEMRKCFETQTVALRSQANTPAPMYDMKETIKHLLLQGQINKAFHQALLANDLNLVEYTLKNADQNAVFTPDCCLEQKVLLSLIQQISADMSNHNEVKQNYLAEALLAIDMLDPITREHAPKVLQELYRNCQMFLLNYPKSSQCSNVRMLMKAVQGYKDKF